MADFITLLPKQQYSVRMCEFLFAQWLKSKFNNNKLPVEMNNCIGSTSKNYIIKEL